MDYEKRRSTYLFFSQQKDQSTQTDSFIFTHSSLICISCNKSSTNLIELGCQHTFCINCIKNFSKGQLKNRDNHCLRCPICSQPLREIDINKINPKYNNIIEHRIMKEIAEKEKTVSCPRCNETFIYEPGIVAGITVNQFGEKIRKKALESLRKYRATCIKCHTVFCVKCKTIPFHEGFTCHEQKLINDDVICRFCREYPAVGCRDLDVCHRVCWRKECKDSINEACMHICDCGHACCGLRGEKEHFGCAECNYEVAICSICKSSCTTSPSVIMKCGHPAHLNCLVSLYNSLKSRGRIKVPRCNHDQTCQAVPYHRCVRKIAHKWIRIDNEIEKITKEKIKEENIKDEKLHVNNPNDPDYYKQPLKFAHDFFDFYLCDKCHSPFYGGHKDCGRNDEDDDIEYKCLRCQREILHAVCPKHGDESMVYKCFFCCNHSSFLCWGNVYFCSECHKNPRKAMQPPFHVCDGKCKFSPHAENGERVVTGYCMKCELEKEEKMLNT